MSFNLYAEIVFPVPLKQVFSYGVPESLEAFIQPGVRCSVSFGRRQTVGIVTGLKNDAPPKVQNLKPIDSILDTEPCLTPDLLKLGLWIADYYYCSVGEALFAMLPSGYRKNPKAFLALKAEASQLEVEKILAEKGPLRGVKWESLRLGTIPLTVRTRPLAEALKKAGLLELRLGEPGETRVPKPGVFHEIQKGPALHTQQQTALTAIESSLEKGEFKTFLLQGVTGSGKTEIYLRAIAEVVKKGKQAIVLIPEIALTPQTVERFTSRFGDQVAVLHSRLTPVERVKQWERVASAEAAVAVGARSALFAPAKNLGLIVVDEEHDSSYKQEETPRYNARDAAIMRAQLCSAVAILGSATPSLESIQNARLGKYVLLSMADRVNKKPLPKIKLVDLREEWKSRNQDRPILSLPLEEAIRENLAKGEQTLLFLNRRGFSTLILCLKCGEQMHCPSCSVPVTFHKSGGSQDRPILLCHYCNWQGPLPETCPACKDGAIRLVGLGTERIEAEMAVKFPEAKIARMDLDTTRKAGSHEAILKKFGQKQIDVLIGTQMVAKGHDFPGVTLVGVIGADTGLALPDFRSSERVFQLMVQVAGRAGRAEQEGIIYLQTFNPEHSSIQAAATHDIKTFAESELQLRKALFYPPFSKLGMIIYRSKYEKKAQTMAEKAANFIRAQKNAGVVISGPAPAAIYKLRGQYRFQLLLRAEKPAPIRNLLALLDQKMPTDPGVFRVVDLDPQSML
jgi:primosomal protein N' (replication factor Y)